MGTIGRELQNKVEELVAGLENLINHFENETGISITATKIRFDEGDCKKKIYLKMQYYNFDQALVNTESQL